MGKLFVAQRPFLSPYRDERQTNLSYMVLLDMWNMFGQKIPQLHRRASEASRLGGFNRATYS